MWSIRINMRKTISLISRITRPTYCNLPTLLFSSTCHVSQISNSNNPLFTFSQFHFHAIPSQDAKSPFSPHLQNSFSKSKTLDEFKLVEAFEASKSAPEMLQIFKQMESCIPENNLGLSSLKLGLQLDREGEPEKALQFALRAFNSLSSNEGESSLPTAMALQLAGSSCFSLNKFRDALGYLNKSKRILSSLEEKDDVLPIKHAVYQVLGNAKTALGRHEEALEDLKMCLDIKEVILGGESKDYGVAVREMAEAYVEALNYKEALNYALKALEIHMKELGNNSVEVAHDRRVLAVIYAGLGDNQSALTHSETSRKVLRSWGMESDVIQAEIDASNILISEGRYEEAVNVLREVVQGTEKESVPRAVVFISMAKALSHQKKLEEARKCLDIACGILNRREKASPALMADTYSEAASQYESMGEHETSISLLKKGLKWLEKSPVEQVSEARISARIGWLLLLTGHVADAIPYMESAAESLKESFGENHYGVGCIYNNLGAAYMELCRPATAAKMYHLSKEIMDVAFGPLHADTITANQNLSKAYAAMKKYDTAIEYQMQAIKGWESHGPGAVEEVKEAHQMLLQFIKMADTNNATPNPHLTNFNPLLGGAHFGNAVVQPLPQTG